MRLERSPFSSEKVKFLDFNSIKVRLEQLLVKFTDSTFKFQFHKGAIRTFVTLWELSNNPLFQFHKGAIRTVCLLLQLILHTNFNSIKVRLELVRECGLHHLSVFQFHKGAIRTGHRPTKG